MEKQSAFSYSYTPGFPEFLHKLGAGIALSTFQAGKLLLISAEGPDKLVMLPRTFERAMGLALAGDMLAVASRHEVTILVNTPHLARSYPRKPDTYDALLTPRATYYTGDLDLHDMALLPNGLMAVNTRFSCLCLIGERYSFAPVWKPPFISALTPDDRCHLNGLAVENGQPRYVTALGRTDSAGAWRENMAGGGILMDVASGEIVASGLAMPHSPVLHDGAVTLLLSATGQLARVDVQSGRLSVIAQLPGFVRGLERIGDYWLVGLSLIRDSSPRYQNLPVAQQELMCGLALVHEPSGQIAGHLRFEGDVRELYAVKLLPGTRRPGVLNAASDMRPFVVTAPDNAWWAMTKEDAGNTATQDTGK